MTNEYADAPVLDPAVLDELRAATGDDDEFLRDLVATYVDEAAGHLDALGQAAAAVDAASIVRPAHTLKSSSASIGAMRLASICRDIEAAGREGRADNAVGAVDLVRSTWTETLEALRSAGLAT
jgi:HPt (histidine-containing phosphotransfer) domain-containing protein